MELPWLSLAGWPVDLGLGSRDNPVELVVIAFPWGAYLGADALNKGIRAHLSTFVRGHLNHTTSKAKISQARGGGPGL